MQISRVAGEPPPEASSKLRPSRVKIACCLCSAAKVRCDRDRPCSRCKTRGTSDLCVDRAVVANPNRTVPKQLKEVKACNPCYLAKVACSDKRPCPRCIRLQQPESCIIVSRRNSSQQQRQRRAQTGDVKNPVSVQTATVSVFTTPMIVPASLRNLFMNAAYIRYSVAEIARFVRDSCRMATLLESLSSTLSDKDQTELRQNLIAIATSKENIPDRVAVQSASMPSPFSVVNNCLPIDLLNIELDTTSDAVVRFQVDVKNPSTMWNTMQLSLPAETLFGFTVREIRTAMELGRAPQSQPSVMFINSYWKLFHPSSWEVIACNYLDCVIRELSSAQFPVRLMRSDGRTVDVLSSWQMGLTSLGGHTITVLFAPLVSDQTCEYSDDQRTMELLSVEA